MSFQSSFWAQDPTALHCRAEIGGIDRSYHLTTSKASALNDDEHRYSVEDAGTSVPALIFQDHKTNVPPDFVEAFRTWNFEAATNGPALCSAQD